ncbi:MAG: toxin-antitoxin system YwqK family antitoxin, partial [Thermodesulfobacteriota bacterium]
MADSSSQKSNLKQGLHKTYYPNEIIKEEFYYKNGKLDGFVKKYDESGFLKESRQYRNGIV